MIVVGKPPHCVRLLQRTNGSELRFGGRVIFANQDLTTLLEFICGDPEAEGLVAFAESIHVGPEKAQRLIEDSLDALHKAGIPRGAWGDGWGARTSGPDPGPLAHGGRWDG